MATITNSLSTNGIQVVLQSNGGALNIATAAVATAVVIGNSSSTTSVNITTGSGGHTVAASNGVFTVTTGTGAISIGADATNKTINLGSTSSSSALSIDTGSGAINIGTSATAKTMTLGNVTGASAVNINTGSGGHTTTTTNGVFTVVTGTGTVTVSGDATANSVNIATGAGAKALTLGSTNTTSAVTINVGSGGLNVPSFTNYGVVGSTSAGLLSDISASTAGFVLTSNGSSALPTFQAAPASGFVWANTTGATQAMAVSTGYVSNDGATLVTFTLPATAAVGAQVAVLGSGSGLWTIAQNAGQTINFNAVSTTTGVSGSVSSTSQYDSITLICNVANSGWVVYQATGNLSVV